MVGRAPVLNALAILAALGLAGEARAHRLAADFRILPGKQIQVEAWFDPGGSASGARVQVLRADGQLLAEGQLGPQGVWVFPCPEVEPLRIVVAAGAGHRKELALTREDLLRPRVCSAVACVNPESPWLALAIVAGSSAPTPEKPAEAMPQIERRSGVSLLRIALGVGGLLAIAAAALVLRQVRRSQAPPPVER